MAVFGGASIVLLGIGVVAIIALIIGLPKIQGMISASPTTTLITPTESPALTATEAVATVEAASVSAILPAEMTDAKDVQMVLVPAGEFTMGSDADDALAQCQKYSSDCDRSWYEDEEPPHIVSLGDFYIDRYEVTNALYAACVDTGACPPPTDTSSATRDSYYGNSEYDNFPVIYIDWNMAKTYCEWRGARLPSEAEWEKAARGTEGGVYPWGDEADNTYANFNEDIGDTTAVGSYESGKSPYDVYDMSGNVWEWVADFYSDAYYQSSPLSNPLGPDSGESHVLRGGSWYDPPYLTRTSIRLSEPVPFDNNFGIRCARSVP